MATKQQDEYLKTAFGIDAAQYRAGGAAVAKQAAPMKEETPAAKKPAKPLARDLDEPPAPPSGVALAGPGNPGATRDFPPASDDTDADKPKMPKDAAMINPQDLVKLRAGLAGIEREMKDGVARQQEIAAEARKANVDLTKTDAIAKVGARLGAALTPAEHRNFNTALTAVQKTAERIHELLDEADEAKQHLANYRALKLEEVPAAEKEEKEEFEKKGKVASTIYDTAVNSLKAVVDFVTGDVVKYPGWIVAQMSAEIAGGDVVKDRIEASFKEIEKEQADITKGLNDVVSQLNKFKAAEIKTFVTTLQNLGKALKTQFDFLKGDIENMGDLIRDLGDAHKGDVGDFAPLLSVYRKISEADALLSKVDAVAQRNGALTDKRWPGVLVPLGTRDKNPLKSGENGVALVYRNGSTNYFIVTTPSATFANGDAAPKALEKLADDYKAFQPARDAYAQVKPLAEQWGKAFSTGMDGPAKH